MHEKLIDRLGSFIELERELRNATNSKELEFVACNLTKRILNYETALFVSIRRGQPRVSTVSGTSDFELTAPVVLLTEAVVGTQSSVSSAVRVVDPDALNEKLQSGFSELGLSEMSIVSLNRSDRSRSDVLQASIVFLRDKSWQVHELKLLEQLAEVIEHARKAFEHKKESCVCLIQLGRL